MSLTAPHSAGCSMSVKNFTSRKITARIVVTTTILGDAGPGDYSFRARIRRIDRTGATAFSPATTVTV